MIVLGNVKKLNTMRLLITSMTVANQEVIEVDRKKFGLTLPIQTLREDWKLSKSSVHDMKRSCSELEKVTIEESGLSVQLFESSFLEEDSIRVMPTERGYGIIETLSSSISEMHRVGVFYKVRSRFTLLMVINLALQANQNKVNWRAEEIKSALNISRNYSFADLVEHVITPVVSDLKSFFGAGVAEVKMDNTGDRVEGVNFKLGFGV
ncbi:hypothetical protein [Vibrio crassostreae]|uniref:hypothetical protein n=1 Tax=Vibrio crassostreae TaxID=246167 RepID=UPI001B316A9C|nr:hypothetical protein [Vibrio crassostreae]